MTLGLTPKQADLLCATARFCEVRVAPESIYGVLHRECFTLFPDEMFADLFTDVGRRSVPPMIVAVVMVLQRSCSRVRITDAGTPQLHPRHRSTEAGRIASPGFSRSPHPEPQPLVSRMIPSSVCELV